MGMWRDDEMAACLHMPPGTEVWACETIESTGLCKGVDSWWHPCTAFFSRNPHTGEAELVADITHGEPDTINAASKPVPTKVLLHPFRKHWPGPEERLNEQVFMEVVEELRGQSEKWSLATAAKAYLSMRFLKHDGIDPADVQGGQAREKMMDALESSWEKGAKQPICASVPIVVWQVYLMRMAHSRDEAAKLILQYMPLFCDKTTPSLLASHLGSQGWVLLDGLEAGGPKCPSYIKRFGWRQQR